MRVLAASFPDDASAHEARERLLSELALAADQIDVESLAQPRDHAGPVAILAGRLQEDVVTAARDVVERHGGTVMMDIDAAESNA
jgi:hypothetical protein